MKANPFRSMLMLAGLLMSPITRAVSTAKAEQFDKFHAEEDTKDGKRKRGLRRTKSSTINQRQIRKNRRRRWAAGDREAFA